MDNKDDNIENKIKIDIYKPVLCIKLFILYIL